MRFPETIDFSWTQSSLLRQITHIPVACRTNNLGDDIQSLAMERLSSFRDGLYVDRDALSKWPRNSLIPLCGWYGWSKFPTPADIVVVGFHCRPASRKSLYENLQWFKSQVKNQGFPAMCRDTATRNFLRRLGVDAEFGGCVTLTFPQYVGPRAGEISIDDFTIPKAERIGALSQLMPEIAAMPAVERLRLADRRVGLLRTAARVSSSRLHVMLPCLAMGTPFSLKLSERIEGIERFSGYIEGVEPERLVHS